MSDSNVPGGLPAATIPPGGPPEFPWRGPELPGAPLPGRTPVPGAPEPGAVPPARVWLDPHAGWQDQLYERLLGQRIVIAAGVLDDAAATRLSAQFLTLDAEGDGPIRLELQNLRAELPAVLTLMGVLDVLRAEVQAFASGETGGPALGVPCNVMLQSIAAGLEHGLSDETGAAVPERLYERWTLLRGSSTRSS